jgi:long-chain acyl-CoA synthetase
VRNVHNFVHPLLRGERVAAAKEALVCEGRRLTYAEFGSRLRRLHSALGVLGTIAGDRVAVLSYNSIAFVELYCGISASGRVQVPLNFRWAEPELAYALRDSGARVLVTDRDPGGLASLVDRVVRIDRGEYEALLASCDETPFDGNAIEEDDIAGLFYTGGTTGESKGVMLTHRNLLANTYHLQMSVPVAADDIVLVMSPLFHAAGSASLLQSIAVGARLVVLPLFDPSSALDLIERERVTATLGVPTMVAAIVEEQFTHPRDVSTLAVFAHGGSPIASEVVRRGRLGFPSTEFVHLYGATETGPLITTMRNEIEQLGTAREKASGQSVVGVEIVIRDSVGQPLPDGSVGEVTVRGNNIMKGYWNKPEQTAAALRDGWYWSGDVGRLDDEGYLFLLDRSKDMIISGGENVYCTEVEDALYSHPAVLEAAVFGIPHDKWGESVHAVVVLRSPASAGELIDHCRSRIGGYKVPRSISFQSEALPKSGPGKVLKRQLRAPFWEGRSGSL